MGILGRRLGSFLGGKIGRFAGNKLGRFTGIYGAQGEKAGEDVGGTLGELLPFKKGGPVKKTTKALLHKGEYVLPKSVKATKKQKAAVQKLHKKSKKGMKRK